MRDFSAKKRLDGADDHILAAFVTTAAFVEHAEAFAYAGCVTKKDFETRGGLVFLVGLELLEQLFGSRLFFAGCGHASIIEQKVRRGARRGQTAWVTKRSTSWTKTRLDEFGRRCSSIRLVFNETMAVLVGSSMCFCTFKPRTFCHCWAVSA